MDIIGIEPYKQRNNKNKRERTQIFYVKNPQRRKNRGQKRLRFFTKQTRVQY